MSRSAEVVGAGAQRHHDLLHGGVAGALADAVDRALDLPGAGSGRRPASWPRPGRGRRGSAWR